jgi:hypothetical protein
MSIEGTYGFVYSGANGLGVGVFRVRGSALQGVDYAGGKYEGTAVENEDGSISIAVDLTVNPGMALVQGTAPQDFPYSRLIAQSVPSSFGDGRPIELDSPPGSVTVMIKRVPDEYERALSEGVSVYIGDKRI